MYECILFLDKRGAKHRVYDKRETTGCMLTITNNVSEKISLTLFMKHEITHLCVVNGQRETTSVLIVVIDSVKAVTSSSLSFSFSSKLSMIARVSEVLNRTVVVDSDWRFDNTCRSYLQSQSELYHGSWWLSTWLVNQVGMLWLTFINCKRMKMNILTYQFSKTMFLHQSRHLLAKNMYKQIKCIKLTT